MMNDYGEGVADSDLRLSANWGSRAKIGPKSVGRPVRLGTDGRQPADLPIASSMVP